MSFAHEPEQVTELVSEGTEKMEGALYLEEAGERQRGPYFLSTHIAYVLD